MNLNRPINKIYNEKQVTRRHKTILLVLTVGHLTKFTNSRLKISDHTPTINFSPWFYFLTKFQFDILHKVFLLFFVTTQISLSFSCFKGNNNHLLIFISSFLFTTRMHKCQHFCVHGKIELIFKKSIYFT